MGTYLNPGNELFAELAYSDNYVDKTGLIAYMNGRIGQEKHLIASSRPRRFGKTIAARMLTAYYSKSCDSREIFRNLKIAQEVSYEKHLNQYNVISLDIQWMKTSAIPEIKAGNYTDIISYIHSEVIRELREAYPEYVDAAAVSLPKVLAEIHNRTNEQFVIIIDEWDCIFREDKDNQVLQREYIDFLRGLFKGTPADRFVKLAYITGILPIKKYGTQSALNNFRELTMIAPDGIAPYIGFTEDEVSRLCEKNTISFEKMQKWYDGYIFDQSDDASDEPEDADGTAESVMHIYSPNSVMEAIDNRKFMNYWSQTETYEDLKRYIEMDFDGLRQMVVDMLGGGSCKVEVGLFQNDLTSFQSAGEVLTLLVHLGYLAYNSRTQEVFIPNLEVRSAFVLSVADGEWGDVYNAIQNSEKLLQATLAMDEDTVADMIRKVHYENSSSLVYNNEISLASVIQVAYYSAARNYHLFRELPTGEGFADMVFIPKRNSGKPAIIVELKWNKSAEGAIAQIKEKKYFAALEEYKGNLLLVGISYDKKTKIHQCRIEKWEK